MIQHKQICWLIIRENCCKSLNCSWQISLHCDSFTDRLKNLCCMFSTFERDEGHSISLKFLVCLEGEVFIYYKRISRVFGSGSFKVAIAFTIAMFVCFHDIFYSGTSFTLRSSYLERNELVLNISKFKMREIFQFIFSRLDSSHSSSCKSKALIKWCRFLSTRI